MLATPLLMLCRPFCIFERCLDSNPESCRGKHGIFGPGPGANQDPDSIGSLDQNPSRQKDPQKMEKVKIFNAGLLDVLFLRLEASPAA